MGGRVFENFQKKQRIFKVSKKPKIVTKSVQTCFELVLGANFTKKNCYPSVPWRLEFSKIFKQIKKISKFQKCPKSFPKASKRVLNVFWGEFFDNFFAQCSMDGRVFKNFQKIKKFSKFQPKTHKTVPKRIQKCFEQVLGQIFRKIFAQFSMECRVFETFQKNQKIFKIPNKKRTKPFPKESKSVLNMFWGNFFEKILPSFPWGVESSKIFKKKQRIFKVPKKPKIVTKSVQTCFELVLGANFTKKNCYPSVPWRLEFSKIFKQIKKISKFQKCPKSFPKASKRVLNVFWGEFFEKNFAQCSMDGRVFKNFQKNQKKFKIPKMPKIVPKSIQRCFEKILGKIFRKIFAQFSMECRVFETFQKNSKNFQNSNQKRTKPFPKESKSVLNMFWCKFFEKFLPSFPWKVESSKIFKKIKKSLKFQKGPKSFPKVSKRVLNVFWGSFFRKTFAQFSMEGRVFKNFQKNQKNFKIPKMPKVVPKSIQTSSERVLRQFFRKTFAQFSLEGRVFESFQKKSKNFQNSNQKRTKPFP